VFDGTDTADKFKSLSFSNYVWLTEDPLYYRAYLSSIFIAALRPS
jgi:putrescine transport system permease protein